MEDATLVERFPVEEAGLSGVTDPINIEATLRVAQVEVMYSTLSALVSDLRGDPIRRLNQIQDLCQSFQDTLSRLGSFRFPEDREDEDYGYGGMNAPRQGRRNGGGLIARGHHNPDETALGQIQTTMAMLQPLMLPFQLGHTLTALTNAKSLGMTEQAAQLQAEADRLSALIPKPSSVEGDAAPAEVE